MKKILFNIITIILIIFIYSCDTTQSKVQVDDEPPTVAFANPDQAVFGDTELVVIASDNEGITRVEFEAHLDDQSLILGEDSTSNDNNEFSVHWSSGQFPRGEWEIHAIAYDATGNKDSAVFHANIEILLRSGGLAIGQYYQGGKIFYLDASGEHGLIAAFNDHDSRLSWYKQSDFFDVAYVVNGADGDGIRAGIENTRKIVERNGNGIYPAKVCDDYVSIRPVWNFLTFPWTVDWIEVTDWYLPSKEELEILKQQKEVIGGFEPHWLLSNYWSSTEAGLYNAYAVLFVRGSWIRYNKSHENLVRAIRAF